jgi:hypothetical protein
MDAFESGVIPLFSGADNFGNVVWAIFEPFNSS